MFKNILLIGKPANSTDPLLNIRLQALKQVQQFLIDAGCRVVECPSPQAIAPLAQTDIDLAVVVGGDGTMLAAARQLATCSVPVIGINQGRLGFITDIALDQLESTLTPMLHGEYESEHRHLLHGQVLRGDQVLFETLAMNDIVVNRNATAGMLELQIHVDGKFVSHQRADGLIVATPTGSTAYALAVGGSLLHPSVAGTILAPIAPHNLSNRPIVLPADVTIEIEQLLQRDACVNFDMQSLSQFTQDDRVVVQRAKQSAQFLHPRGWNYFDSLRHKLHWNKS